MKRTLTVTFFLLLFNLTSPSHMEKEETEVFERYEAEKAEEAERKAFELKKQKILDTMIYIESRGDSLAYNKREKAAGILQIRPIMVRHANLIAGYERFKLKDRWDPVKSIEMWEVVMDHHNPAYDPDTACYIWNGGHPWYKPSLDPYLQRFNKKFNT